MGTSNLDIQARGREGQAGGASGRGKTERAIMTYSLWGDRGKRKGHVGDRKLNFLVNGIDGRAHV